MSDIPAERPVPEPPAPTTTSYETNGVTEKLWLYEENIKQLYELDKTPDRKTFLDDFFNYRKKNGLYSKIPVIARRPLDVYALYCIVQKYGGFESTMKNRMWSQIARELDLPRTMTSGAFTLKLKYIRLLYQFECHKCNKPVNQAILYNESMIGETKERYDDHAEDYHLRNQMATRDQMAPREQVAPRDHLTPRDQMTPRDEFDEFLQEKEKIYREALRRSTEKDFVIPVRQPEHHVIDHSTDPLPPTHALTKTSSLDDPSASTPLAYPHRYHSPDRSTVLKRNFQVGEQTKEQHDDMQCGKRHGVCRVVPHTTKEDLFKTFSVDFFEITDDMVTIKVCLNDERYEGVLKCC